MKATLSALAGLYRRTGADLPFGDPRPSHGAEMEGYFWRITQPETGDVVVALCGVNRHRAGHWATVALAAHPGDFVRSAEIQTARASRERYEVEAGTGVLRADARSLRVDLAPDARLDVRFEDAFDWPHVLAGGGIASVVPWLNQYWHPHVLGARVAGSARVGGRDVRFDGATAYAEKNWGMGFPEQWWWGQAQAFERPDVCVVFSGGRLALGRLAVDITGVVVRVGDEVVQLTPPLASVSGSAEGGRWRVHGRDLVHEVRIEGDGNGTQPAVLPVPLPAERRNIPTDFEHLAGRMHVVVRRRGRTLFEGESRLAGLEIGSSPSGKGPRSRS